MAIADSKALCKEVDLDAIIAMLMDGLSITADSIFKEREQAVMDHARSYTKTVAKQVDDKILSDKEVTTIVEENFGDLLDSICESNQTFLEAGVRIGANLLLQMLGYKQTECVQNLIAK